MGESIEKAIEKSVRIGELEKELSETQSAHLSWKAEAHRMSDELARLRAEVEKLRTMVDTMTQANDEMHALYEERGVEVEKLRADVVWAVRNEARVFWEHQNHLKPFLHKGQDPLQNTMFVEGTDASLLSAVRRAREGSSDGE